MLVAVMHWVGLDYRFGSPVFLFDESEHPTTLVSFAFTNRPRLKEMSAVWNSEEKIQVLGADSERNRRTKTQSLF